MNLNAIEVRVLGSLIEKEITTPEYYPLSLNALLAACNQKSSREPVMELMEDEVLQALHSLEDKSLTAVVRDSRVPKYENRARTVLNLRRDETAVLCLLLLRGPQTPGELRSRSERLYSFDGIDAVESTLRRLTSQPEDAEPELRNLRPLMAVLPRQPGSREVRYAHLLGAPVEVVLEAAAEARRGAAETAVPAGLEARLAALEAEVVELHAKVARLEASSGDRDGNELTRQ